MNIIRHIKNNVKHQDIGGKEFRIEFKLTNNQVFSEAITGNWACYNFVQRRPDFNCYFNHQLYYGKVGDLGYVIAEDELEPLGGTTNE